MSISIKIHDMNLIKKQCVVTIKDNGVPIMDGKFNIGLELNPDGTANTDYIKERAKFFVKIARYSNTVTSVVVTGHPSLIYIG